MNDGYIASDNSECKEGEGLVVERGSMSHEVVSLRFIFLFYVAKRVKFGSIQALLNRVPESCPVMPAVLQSS